MSTLPTCRLCGAPLLEQNTQVQCPACLLRLGLQSGSVEASLGPGLAETQDLERPPVANATGPDNAIPQPGERFGNYLILRALGSGGMGTVFEAEQLDTGRRVALKLLTQRLDSTEARKRFFREGRLAASINHPHSVYVYGTEAINGVPVISMELVAGGTLQQCVKEAGPLLVGKAVDAMLQVVAGLAAAQQQGVLHRDVKPSNCFVDAEGSVKVGDFGLSISTAAQGESQLTADGAVLGTPAFSSPEQLKGDELDVRSDIYAVGVTLYYLLTGRTPFVADHLVKLVAMVLEDTPPSPVQFRPDIPGDLARVVAKCLNKVPAQRYKDYAELTAALRPYSSESPTPASLSRRFAAGVIDSVALALVSALPWVLNTLSALPDGLREWYSPNRIGVAALSGLVCWFYYAIPEACCGATLGKWLFGLRVVNDRRDPPTLPHALGRSALYCLLPSLPYLIGLGPDPSAAFGQNFTPLKVLWLSACYLVLVLMFTTARRRNGFAAWHDLASGTRVIVRPMAPERPRIDAESNLTPLVPPGAERIGPYCVLESLSNGNTDDWFLGYDAQLLRKVWLRRVPLGTPAVPPTVRNVARPTRLRWLAGRRSDAENWDAFEANAGRSLIELIAEPQPWSRVRYWLYDLALELAAGLKDHSLPQALSLDRVWITADGVAKLLDCAVPGRLPEIETIKTDPFDVDPLRRFLHQVAVASLNGQPLSAAIAVQHSPTCPLPLHALPIVNGILHVERPEVIAAQLRTTLHRTPAITQRHRIKLLITCLFLPLLTTCLWATLILMSRVHVQQMPDIQPLQDCLWMYQPIPTVDLPSTIADPDDRAAMEIYIAGKYGATIRDTRIWSSSYAQLTIPQWSREVAEAIVANHPQPSAREFAQAESRIRPILAAHRTVRPFQESPFMQLMAMFFGGVLTVYVAIPATIAAAVFRGGLALKLLGIGVVTETGQPASRARMTWRAMITWSPIVVFAMLIAAFAQFASVNLVVSLLGVAYLALAIGSSCLPGRGLADRLARTYLVPR